MVCDSIGSDFGARGFASRFQQTARARGFEVDVRVFGGIPVDKVADAFAEERDVSGADEGAAYDLALVHVGNPDVHPRLPRRPLAALRRRGLRFMKDGLFMVLPRVTWQVVFRLPLFLLRLVVIRVRPEFFGTPEQVAGHHRRLVEQLARRAGEVRVLPVFHVRAGLYGPAHNQRADAVNAALAAAYGDGFLRPAWTEPSFYRPHYAADGYHLRDAFHEQAARALADDLLRKQPDRPASASTPAPRATGTASAPAKVRVRRRTAAPASATRAAHRRT